MQVVGLANEAQITAFDKERPFRINEYLIVEDKYSADSYVGVVVKTESYNKMQDVNMDGSSILNTLKLLDVDASEHTFHLAVVKLLETAETPIQPGSVIREPLFEEVHHLLVHGDPDTDMMVGMIKATENMGAGMPAQLQSRMYLVNKDGKVIKQKGVPFIFPIRAMQQYPHIGIFGGSGSGKSYTLRVWLEELMKLGIPMLIFDPHYELTFTETPTKAPDGYRDVDFENRFRVFKVGEDVGAEFTDISTNDLVSLLNAASELSEQMVSVIEAMHKKADNFISFMARIETTIMAKEAEAKGEQAPPLPPGVKVEGKDLPLSSFKGVKWRLERIQKSGLFQHGIKNIEEELTSGKLVVVQGADFLLKVMASYAIKSIYRLRREFVDATFRNETGAWFPPFIVVADEAHNFAPKGDKRSPASRDVIREVAQEGRKYGVFLALATQRPALLDETITAQLNTKVICRTVRAQDIGIIAQETDLTQDECRNLPKLRSGHYYISSAIFGKTFAVQGRMAKTSSPHLPNPFDELGQMKAQFTSSYKDKLAPIIAQLPEQRIDQATMSQAMELYMKLYNKSIQPSEIEKMLEALVKEGVVEKKSGMIGDVYYLKAGVVVLPVAPGEQITGTAPMQPAKAAAAIKRYQELLSPIFAELPEHRLELNLLSDVLTQYQKYHNKSIQPSDLEQMLEQLAGAGIVQKQDQGWLGVIYYWQGADNEPSVSPLPSGNEAIPAAVAVPEIVSAPAEPEAPLWVPSGTLDEPAEPAGQLAAVVVGASTASAAELPAAPGTSVLDDPAVIADFRKRMAPVFASLTNKRLDVGSLKKAVTAYKSLHGGVMTNDDLMEIVQHLVEAGIVTENKDFLGSSYTWKG